MGRWRQLVDLSHCFLSVLACQCIGAGYTITLKKKGNNKKVTHPRKKITIKPDIMTLVTNDVQNNFGGAKEFDISYGNNCAYKSCQIEENMPH